MKPYLFPTLFMSLLLSLVISRIVYYGFTPNYAADIFSKASFNNRFDHDVYKYRILSKYLLFRMDDYLASDMPEKGADVRLRIRTPDASERFYTAFYELNTIFLVLTSMMMVLLLDMAGVFVLKGGEGILMIFLATLLIGLTEYTVCCYDVSSYFFQLLSLYIYLRFFCRHFFVTLAALCVLVVLSTLNRESSALSVSILSLLLVLRYGLVRKTVVSILSLAVSFLATYIALRHYIIDPQQLAVYNIQAGKILLPTNMMGLLFWAAFIYLPMFLAHSAENRWMVVAFHLASLPYIYTVLVDGVLWEVRLYVPLFLGSFMLSKVDPAMHKVQLTDVITRLGRVFKGKGKIEAATK